MGIIKDAKVNIATEAAKRAASEGRSVMLYRQNVPWSKSGWSGEITDVSLVIEAVEAQGWRLDQMNYDAQQSSHGGCLMLFRRDRQAVQPQAMPMAQPAGQPEPQWQPHPGYGQQQPGLGGLAQPQPWGYR